MKQFLRDLRDWMVVKLYNRGLKIGGTWLHSPTDKQGTLRLYLMFPEPLPDEDGFIREENLPWWCPFNAFLHIWTDSDDSSIYHNHPRWSITIGLKGQLLEHTPDWVKHISPGTIRLRRPSCRHFITLADKSVIPPVTLFIVGRRKYVQNHFDLTGNVVTYKSE